MLWHTLKIKICQHVTCLGSYPTSDTSSDSEHFNSPCDPSASSPHMGSSIGLFVRKEDTNIWKV